MTGQPGTPLGRTISLYYLEPVIYCVSNKAVLIKDTGIVGDPSGSSFIHGSL
jgi:hypothetical protein